MFNAIIIECIIGVHCFFNDSKKTALWFNTPNPLLGNIAPWTMLVSGREKKLLKIINQMLDGIGP